MLKLSVMACNGYFPALVFKPEHGLNRVSKDSQRLWPSYELREEDIIRSNPLNLKPQYNSEPWKPSNELFDNNQFVMIDPTLTKCALTNIQDCCTNSTHFSFKFPMTGLMEVERDGLLSNLTAIQTVTAPDYKPYFPDMDFMDSRIIYPNSDFDSKKPLADFVADLVQRSEIMFREDGHVSLTGTRREMKDLLSILAEFYLSKNSNISRKQLSLVPHFNRLDYDKTSYYGSSLEIENVMVAPSKSPEKAKLKKSSKKRLTRAKTSTKHGTNYIQACESLLSIIVDKNRTQKSAIPMLKRSTPELPTLLTQFSASIAGTGIAVLFSVMSKVASGRVPFCSSKLLNTGLGLGLVWLSWAVNRLRDTIVIISRNSSKKNGSKNEEMMQDLDRNVREIYFRAAALMAVLVLRLA